MTLWDKYFAVWSRYREVTYGSAKSIKHYCEFRGYLPPTGARFAAMVSDPHIAFWCRRESEVCRDISE